MLPQSAKKYYNGNFTSHIVKILQKPSSQKDEDVSKKEEKEEAQVWQHLVFQNSPPPQKNSGQWHLGEDDDACQLFFEKWPRDKNATETKNDLYKIFKKYQDGSAWFELVGIR